MRTDTTSEPSSVADSDDIVDIAISETIKTSLIVSVEINDGVVTMRKTRIMRAPKINRSHDNGGPTVAFRAT